MGYLNALKAYQDEVGLLQDQYRSDMELYEAKAKVFEAQMEDYQSARLTYEGARAEAINTAEGLIKNVREEFGWAFVNKNDPEVFSALDAQDVVCADDHHAGLHHPDPDNLQTEGYSLMNRTNPALKKAFMFLTLVVLLVLSGCSLTGGGSEPNATLTALSQSNPINR